jgi:ArsR family metal-binding transcriptional regulator
MSRLQIDFHCSIEIANDRIVSMDKLVEEYTIRIVEPGCAPGSGHYGLQINLENDISEIFPYINAEIKDGYYDHVNHVLIWRESGQAYALHPGEIRIARIEDSSKANQIASEIIGKINRFWQDRHNITPCYAERKLPTTIDLFKLLPKTNCKQCGFVTCLAYADALRSGQVRLEDCLPLSESKYEENKLKLRDISPSV